MRTTPVWNDVDAALRRDDHHGMADGELTLTLDDETARRLQEAADAAGLTVGEFAAGLIGAGLGDRWSGARAALAEYDQTGVSYSLAEGMAAFDAAVTARLASGS